MMRPWRACRKRPSAGRGLGAQSRPRHFAAPGYPGAMRTILPCLVLLLTACDDALVCGLDVADLPLPDECVETGQCPTQTEEPWATCSRRYECDGICVREVDCDCLRDAAACDEGLAVELPAFCDWGPG